MQRMQILGNYADPHCRILSDAMFIRLYIAILTLILVLLRVLVMAILYDLNHMI